MSQWYCKKCGHIGYPEIVHNDERCEKCFSRYIVEIENKIKTKENNNGKRNQIWSCRS